MNILKKAMNLSSSHSDLIGSIHNEAQIVEEEIKRECEAFLIKYKEQLDDYIVARDNLCFVELITFGTDLIHSKLVFARTISSKLREYLIERNFFYESNLKRLLHLTKKLIEENNKKTDEFLLNFNPGTLHHIMESAQKELAKYCSQIYPTTALQPSFISQTNESKKTILPTPSISKVSKEAKNQSSNRVAKDKLFRPTSSKKRRIMSFTNVEK